MPVTINGTTGIAGVDGSAGTPAVQGADSNTGMFFPAADTIAFAEGGAEVMRIDSSGNVQIGTTTNKTNSWTGGGTGLTIGAATAPTVAVWDTTDSSYVGSLTQVNADLYLTNTANGIMVFNTNNTERARIDSSGRLLVGTTSAPGQTGGVVVANNELFVYNIPTTASGANCNISSGESNRFYRSTSALKYKQDIRDIESIDINKFRPVRYKSKCENDDQTKDHFGIIADEVHAAGITELVSYGADGEVEGFQYDRLTVVLLKAIQELKAELDTAKARIAALEAA